MGKKILLIGIDGGTWEIFDPLMEMGVMPTLKKLCKEGVRTNLISTEPPLTAPAWTSLMTGKYLEKHEIFHFLKFDRKTKKIHLVNSTHVKGETIWQILSRHGRKVISLFFPYTYPPYPVNGIMVSGFDTPSMEHSFTYPEKLKEELISHFPQLDVTTGKLIKMLHSPTTTNDALREAVNSLNTKLDASLYILNKEKDYDLFGIQMQESDIIQHLLWKEIEDMLQHKNNSVTQGLKEFYSLIDHFVHTLVEKSRANVLFIVSDHGFMKKKRAIYLNYILFKEGLITMKLPYRLQWELRRMGKAGNFVADLIKNTRKFFVDSIRKTSKTSPIERLLLPSLYNAWRRINWKKTEALVVFGGSFAGWGYIFSQDREDVVKRLKEIEKKYSIYIKELTFFHEELTARGFPDFAVKLEEGDIADPLIRVKPANSTETEGTHSRKGIFLTTLSFQSASIKVPHITDICPTILHLLSLPVPRDIDGKVIEGVAGKEKVKYEEPHPEERVSISSEEEEKVLERLKDLGYIE